jgi:circadian clock protein KaiC
MTDDGIRLLSPYLGESGALTGSARKQEEARTRREEVRRRAEVVRIQQQIEQRRRRATAQMEALKADLDADQLELQALLQAEEEYLRAANQDAAALMTSRKT